MSAAKLPPSPFELSDKERSFFAEDCSAMFVLSEYYRARRQAAGQVSELIRRLEDKARRESRTVTLEENLLIPRVHELEIARIELEKELGLEQSRLEQIERHAQLWEGLAWVPKRLRQALAQSLERARTRCRELSVAYREVLFEYRQVASPFFTGTGEAHS